MVIHLLEKVGQWKVCGNFRNNDVMEVNYFLFFFHAAEDIDSDDEDNVKKVVASEPVVEEDTTTLKLFQAALAEVAALVSFNFVHTKIVHCKYCSSMCAVFRWGAKIVDICRFGDDKSALL